MSDALDFAELRRCLERFSVEAPPILRLDRLTEQFAADLERSLAVADSPFTLAVVGQMRVGKSTLINALVGDDLAIPGVTETTATVNWFRYGDSERLGKFRVVWDDAFGTDDVLPLSEKERWLGNSELAARTRYLEFFGDAPFLRRASVVDTPGARSTIESHEEVAKEFLLGEGRAERDTNFYGGAADCVIYVLPPVTRSDDSETLGAFRSQNRFLQSTPFNSVGVVHKWETLDHPEPWNAAVDQARKAFEALKSYVCDVIPVSGPLARSSQKCPKDFWDDALRFVRGTSPDVLEALTARDTRFLKERPDCDWGPDARASLRAASQLPWACFKTVLSLAAASPCRDGEELCRTVRKVSGIDRLLEFLEARFFARAELIRSATSLERAMRIADAARGRLRNRLADLDDETELGKGAREEIGRTETAPRAKEFVVRRLAELDRERRVAQTTLRRLEEEVRPVRAAFRQFDRDCQAVHAMDERPELFGTEEKEEIMALLGVYGARLDQRLGEASNGDIVALTARLNAWLGKRQGATAERLTVLDQVASRLEAALRIRLFDSTPG